MNYAKMIAILERVLWLREFCRDSEYVCDAVNHEVGDCNYNTDRTEKDAITTDINEIIGHRFSAQSYLNSIGSDQHVDDFRTEMINKLIAKYTAALAEVNDDGNYNQLIG